jgi:hypothetical protein
MNVKKEDVGSLIEFFLIVNQELSGNIPLKEINR